MSVERRDFADMLRDMRRDLDALRQRVPGPAGGGSVAAPFSIGGTKFGGVGGLDLEEMRRMLNPPGFRAGLDLTAWASGVTSAGVVAKVVSSSGMNVNVGQSAFSVIPGVWSVNWYVQFSGSWSQAASLAATLSPRPYNSTALFSGHMSTTGAYAVLSMSTTLVALEPSALSVSGSQVSGVSKTPTVSFLEVQRLGPAFGVADLQP